ncbi:MAG: hypothetical protein J1E38_01805 [Paramuribaculum sp.]|nr:hypothetical protein [Paramuribaculum sp.]
MQNTNRPGSSAPYWIYIVVTGLAFIALTVVFLLFPRSKYSELEKRDLAEFPDLSNFNENPTGLTEAISEWFNDSEPYRDDFMTLSMNVRNAMRFNMRKDEDAVIFRSTGDDMDEMGEMDDMIVMEDMPEEESGGGNTSVHENPLADANAKVANKGIIVVGNAPNVRALMAFGGSYNSGTSYANMLNEYASAFPGVKIYALVASSAGEFYTPEKASNRMKPETPTLQGIKDRLGPGVKYVDVHSALAGHVNEDIFLRTDHHWAPLGAYYAAQAFAKTAGVPFRTLDSYERRVIHGYVGSMYGYSKDISVKNSPEDFVYYKPKGLNYTALFTSYKVNKDYKLTGESKQVASPFFKDYKDGSSAAYCTFMGGDQNLVHVKTGSPSGRRLLIIKDSFGNALPGYLFYSFSDIHVVDFRYFNRNIKQYVADNNITDIVVAFNIFNACNSGSSARVKRFLTQGNGGFVAPSTSGESERQPKASKRDSTATAPVTESPKEHTPEETPKDEPEKVEIPVHTPAEPDTI